MSRLRFNPGAFKELRTSPGVTAYTREVAEQVAAAAGPGFAVKPGAGRNRARFVVVPTTPDAYRANYEDLAVVRALGGI
jgi:hypothetical protein